MTRRKAKKKASPKTAAEIRRLRVGVDKILAGDAARANLVTERAAKRAKGRIPAPREVAAKDDPRSPEHLTVAVYVSAAPEDSAMPADLLKWAKFVRKYDVRLIESERVKQIICAGFPCTIQSRKRWFTVYAVLESGRAFDDLKRAGEKLLAEYRALN